MTLWSRAMYRCCGIMIFDGQIGSQSTAGNNTEHCDPMSQPPGNCSHFMVLFVAVAVIVAGSCLKTGHFSNYNENKKNSTRMLDTLFIEDFIDSMEEYFHFWNHNYWQ